MKPGAETLPSSENASRSRDELGEKWPPAVTGALMPDSGKSPSQRPEIPELSRHEKSVLDRAAGGFFPALSHGSSRAAENKAWLLVLSLPLLFAQNVSAQGTAGSSQRINYWEVMTGGGPVVAGVLLALIASSVASWGIIFRKYLHLRKAQRESVLFLDAFRKSKRLDTVYKQADELSTSPISQVFRAGYVELSKLNASPETLADPSSIENIERALRRTTNAELVHLEASIPFLATTAAAAPFVGLLGTVWGIMGAFHRITLDGNASLTTVAGPIAEALIATAVGLFAAIPAVVAYNYFASRIRTLENEMENFGADFLNIVKRHFLKPNQGA